MSFGLRAYIIKVESMRVGDGSIWGLLEADERADELRNLVGDHYLPSMGPTEDRYFVVGKASALGTRGEVLAMGGREQARKSLKEDRERTLKKRVRQKTVDLKKAQEDLEAFLNDRQMEGQPEAGQTVKAAPKRKQSKSVACSYTDDDDEEEEDEEEDEAMDDERPQRDVRQRPAAPDAEQLAAQGAADHCHDEDAEFKVHRLPLSPDASPAHEPDAGWEDMQ